MSLLDRNDVAKYTELLEAAKMAKRPHEVEAWLNVAFYLNQQYVQYKDDSLSLIPRENDSDPNKAMPRPTFNKIMHYVRKQKASALRDWPKGDVLPAGVEPQDISIAQVASAYIEMLQDPTVINYDAQLATSVLWAILAGTSWMKWPWSEQHKRPDVVPLSFFEGYVDPYARDFGRKRWFIHEQFLDPEMVEDIYDVAVEKKDISQADPTKTALIRGMGSMPVSNGCMTREFWHIPTKRYKQGLYAVTIAGRRFLVEPDDLPYDVGRRDGKLPFTMIGALERPDSVYWASPVTYLRSAQMAFNQYWAQRILFRRKFQPKWLIEQSTQLEAEPDDSPAQILRGTWTPGLQPQIVQPSTYMPSDDGQLMEEQMMHVVGQHEVSQAQVPGRVEAAKAIEMLLNQDDDSLHDLRKTIAQANSEGWYHAIRLAQEFEKTDIMVAAYSPEGAPEVKYFKAQKLKPGFRVRTTMTSGLSASRTARQQQVMDLWDRKLIQDPQEAAKMLDLPLQGVMADRALDVRLARNENITLAGGEAVVPNSWDDHALHLREHNAYRKTTEFLQLDTETKQKFEHHCQTHKDFQVRQVTEDAQLNAIMQGQPPQATEAAPPAPPGQDSAQGEGQP